MTVIISDLVREHAERVGLHEGQVSDYVERVVTGYIECMLWSESCRGTAPQSVCDHFGKTGDERSDCDKSLSHDLNYGECDLAGEAWESIRSDVENFTVANWADLYGRNEWMDAGQAGHDFWLTRNGHGAGFWDRGLGDRGQRLTDEAHVYGEATAYVGDDGLIYVD